jgi:hypothetical protein
MLSEDRRADRRIAMTSRSMVPARRDGSPVRIRRRWTRAVTAWHPAWLSGGHERCRSMPTAMTHPESPPMSADERAQREHLQGERCATQL